MVSTCRISVEKAKGYTGKRSGKCQVAAVTAAGLSKVQPSEIEWGNSQLYKKSKGIWTEHYDLTPGLYQVCEYDQVRSVMIAPAKSGAMIEVEIDEARASAIVELMEGGETFDAARQATKVAR